MHVSCATRDAHWSIVARGTCPRLSGYFCPHRRFAVVDDPLASLRSSAMEPMKDSSNVTRLPGAEDIRLREPPHNFEAEQALLGAILINNAAYQRVAEFLRPEHFADPLHGKLFDSLSRLIERGQVVSAVTLKTYVEQDEDMKAAGGATYLARLAAASVHVIDATAFGQAVHDLYLRRQLIDLGEGVVNGAFGGDVDETALNQIEIGREEALRPRELGPDRGRLQALPRRADRGHGRGRGGLPPRRPAHRRRLRPLPARPASGRPAPVGPHHPGRPPLDGKDRARHQHRLQRRPRLSRGDRRGQAQGGRRRGGRLLLAGNVVRTARHPHARRAGRSAVGEDPQGRAHNQRLRQGPVGQPRAGAPQLLHRRHAGTVDRGPAHPRPPAEAHARAGAAGRRLPPAPLALGQEPPGQPRAGGLGDHPRPRRLSPRSSTCRCSPCRS